MAAKVTVAENSKGTGYTVRVGKQAVAWVSPRGVTIGRTYRAELDGKPIPPAVAKAIAKARDAVRES
jgi:hypothetical protein